MGKNKKIWPTPVVSDKNGASRIAVKKGNPKCRLRAEVHVQAGTKANLSDGSLNPTWECWLMGYYLAWTDLRADYKINLLEKIVDKYVRSYPGNWLPEPSKGIIIGALPDDINIFEGRLSTKSFRKSEQIEAIGNAVVPQIPELLFIRMKNILEEEI